MAASRRVLLICNIKEDNGSIIYFMNKCCYQCILSRFLVCLIKCFSMYSNCLQLYKTNTSKSANDLVEEGSVNCIHMLFSAILVQ